MPQPKRKPKAWAPHLAPPVKLRPAAANLANLQPQLGRLVEALGSNGAARMLGADPSQISRWKAGSEPISNEMARRVMDLHDILTRILRIYTPPVAALWLAGSEPLLGGARPMDVLALEGAAPVIRAIEGIAAGVYS